MCSLPIPPADITIFSATQITGLVYTENDMKPIEILDKAACGVGFLASRKNQASHQILCEGLSALNCVEHRGACAADQISGDGAGIMTDIPFEMLGYESGTIALASLFTPVNPERRRIALNVFEQTFGFYGLDVLDYRDVPTDNNVLGAQARKSLPYILHAFIKRPEHCRTDESFERLLHMTKQHTRTKERKNGISKEFFFTSLSSKTVVYKALSRAEDLGRFYLDLQNPEYKTRFTLFHRRFSTNTISTWDKAQPFRLIAHNGEINTIAGNRSWGLSREKAVGLQMDELLTHEGISDSGSLNEMAEALRYRSNIPQPEDVLALMMPPATKHNDFYRFWSRSMEPWDGPAFITYCDGNTVGARLDRNGFRPCRWMETPDFFYLSSEAGTFNIDEATVLRKGTLPAGNGVKVDLERGKIHFRDPGESRENHDAKLDARLVKLDRVQTDKYENLTDKIGLFSYTQEDLQKMIMPMALEGKEAIGSMGDTARLALFSDQSRPFFDFFYQHFAQVTNPPLDYIREKMVTDLIVHLGRKPNIFEKKELIPPMIGIEVEGPVLTLGQMAFIHGLNHQSDTGPRIRSRQVDMLFRRDLGVVGFKNALKTICDEAILAVHQGVTIITISDRKASYENPAIPSLLALRAIVNVLNEAGTRLKVSVIVDSAEIRTTHHLAALIGFGASAVCPYMALQLARDHKHPKMSKLDAHTKEKNIVKALEDGLLKIMAKSGISVVRSYQTSKLFTALGLHKTVMHQFFPGVKSPIGGLNLEDIVEHILRYTAQCADPAEQSKLVNTYLFKEHAKGDRGEMHNMTISRTRLIHKIVREKNLTPESFKLYEGYLKAGEEVSPISLRHLLDYKKATEESRPESIECIMTRFGSGAMSFGAISAESQRDIFYAMKEVGGRSNSGEGGENPFYHTEGISASTKQVASGRFGVTAQYLVTGDEIQIKIAQGAKPGEGGQLMAPKVDEHIANARHALPNIDLISPPPLHDIYSIEDLKQLIYELKEVHPTAKINVKLVAGANIGTIAVGVAKAGADIIHVSGWDGGTGAATLVSMKHAGLPFEIGLSEVHRALAQNGLREKVILRADGGIHTGKDIIIAALLGAEEYDFGKLLLIAEGCMMARICHTNTCPTGIATQDPKYKQKYKGEKQHVVNMLKLLAEDVRSHLSKMGFTSLDEIIGRFDLLQLDERFAQLADEKHLNLELFLSHQAPAKSAKSFIPNSWNPVNTYIVEQAKPAIEGVQEVKISHDVINTDRALLSALAGEIARREHQALLERVAGKQNDYKAKPIDITLKGSAGQGFGAFLTEPISVRLIGEANDSVCKSMSGGKVVIVPPKESIFVPGENAIIGNVALYGATGGTLYVHGTAGDRFAVRNSGATAIVEGVGLHACEYMTSGTVIILGSTSYNVGAGMTGGELIALDLDEEYINRQYITEIELSAEDETQLQAILGDYVRETGSKRAKTILENWKDWKHRLTKLLPVKVAQAAKAKTAQVLEKIEDE